MKLKIIKNGQAKTYKFESFKNLEEALKTKAYESIEQTDQKDQLILSFRTDPDFKRLRLLVILSPIFISIFDNGKTDLEFFRKNLQTSNFTYGLYESFFEGFDLVDYLDYYKNHKKTEDIMMDENLEVYFRINYMNEAYILALVAMVEGLILTENTRDNLLGYFAKIRNDIVINGRRSILANSIQAFYLSKYVVAWALDLYKLIENDRPDLYKYIDPIYKLTNNLKTPGIEKD